MEVVETSIENNAGNRCNKYDYVASKSIYINNHMLKHNTGHKCDKCQKTHNSSKVLEEHIQKTHITKLHECTKCGAKFMVEHALSQHI